MSKRKGKGTDEWTISWNEVFCVIVQQTSYVYVQQANALTNGQYNEEILTEEQQQRTNECGRQPVKFIKGENKVRESVDVLYFYIDTLLTDIIARLQNTNIQNRTGTETVTETVPKS